MKNKTLSTILFAILAATFIPAIVGFNVTEGYYTLVGLALIIFVPLAAIRLSKIKD